MPVLRSLLFLSFLVLVAPHAAFTSSCILLTPRGAFELADVVFSGVVTDTFGVREDTGFVDGAGDPLFNVRRVARLQVIDIWKGAIDSLVLVSTGTENEIGSLALWPGERYLVYASIVDSSGTLSTSFCSRTMDLHRAELQNEFEAWSEQRAADADFDGSGRVDFADFLLFADGYGTNQPQFDLNRDAIVNFPDFLDFVHWFGETVDPY